MNRAPRRFIPGETAVSCFGFQGQTSYFIWTNRRTSFKLVMLSVLLPSPKTIKILTNSLRTEPLLEIRVGPEPKRLIRENRLLEENFHHVHKLSVCFRSLKTGSQTCRFIWAAAGIAAVAHRVGPEQLHPPAERPEPRVHSSKWDELLFICVENNPPTFWFWCHSCRTLLSVSVLNCSPTCCSACRAAAQEKNASLFHL